MYLYGAYWMFALSTAMDAVPEVLQSGCGKEERGLLVG